jgi:ectoine hydroxylase-related dioxygenase (phytanoyl-CoA dioxygenase family)
VAVESRPAVKARAVTPEEVAFYRENGWVKLERLIEPDLAAELLAAAQELMGERGESAIREGVDYETVWFNDYHFPAREGREPFASLTYAPDLGRNTQLFLERPIAVRHYSDMLAVKLPSSKEKGAPTHAHQDGGIQFDRIGKTTFWIALNEIPPERGAMRFYSGSQKEGPLGDRAHNLFEIYPYLQERYPLSEPIHLQPGDATVHSQLVIHEAPANTTTEPRWAYITLYFPTDAKYSGRLFHGLDDLGLTPGEPFDHPNFPLVCEL